MQQLAPLLPDAVLAALRAGWFARQDAPLQHGQQQEHAARHHAGQPIADAGQQHAGQRPQQHAGLAGQIVQGKRLLPLRGIAALGGQIGLRARREQRPGKTGKKGGQ